MTGRVFEVQHFALYDGPGIRTVIYLKGCPLRCEWCHNPEGQSVKPEMFYYPEKCADCGMCAEVCPRGAHSVADGKHRYNRELCDGCGQCAAVCLNSAMIRTGETVDSDAIMNEVICDIPFYGNDGGITLSGGEPLMQPDFACDLLSRAKEKGIHTCMETCGYAAPDAVSRAADLTDLFLFDIKETDPRRHAEFTGAAGGVILQNLKFLSDLGNRIILRCPVIPGANMRPDYFEDTAQLAESLPGVTAVELEPYHPLGLAKYNGLGRTAGYGKETFLSPGELAPFAETMRKITSKPVRLSNGEPV